jgi:hypothetical protein
LLTLLGTNPIFHISRIRVKREEFQGIRISYFLLKRFLFTIYTLKPTNTLILNLYFYTQFVVAPTCFDLAWSSSRNYLLSIKQNTKLWMDSTIIRPGVFHFTTKYNRFSSNTSITFMKYSLGYMFRPQLCHHQALYMYRSFILQYILGS